MKKTTLRPFIFIILASMVFTTAPAPSDSDPLLTPTEEKPAKKTRSTKRIAAWIIGSICAGIALHYLVKKVKQQKFANATAPEPSARPNPDDYFAKGQRINDPYSNNYYNYGNYHYCSICFDYRVAKEDIVRLHCGHSFCRDCLNGHINISKKDKNLPRCPQVGCRRECTREDLEKTLPDKKDLSEFDNIAAEEGLKKVRGLKYCPNPKCGFAFINECNIATDMTCQKCQQTYCARCLQPHSNSFWANLFGNGGCPQDTVDKFAQKAGAKRCPACKAMIEKNGGCPHMTCQQCKYEFCWTCGARWTSYGHNCFFG